MARIFEIISFTTSLLGMIITGVSLWNITKGIIKRLAIIQNKLNSLKSLLVTLRANVNDIEKFLTTNHGYNIRGLAKEIEENLLEQYGDEDTGF